MATRTSTTTTTDEPEPDDDLARLLAPRGRRYDRLSVVLAVLLLGSLAFTAGALVNRPEAAATTAGGGAPGGFPGVAGQRGGGAAGSQGSAQSGSSGASGASGTAATPAVIGTVVSVKGSTLTVKNLGGKTVKVTVPGGTTVTRRTSSPLSALAAGTTVNVSGTSASDGSVTADAITATSTEKESS